MEFSRNKVKSILSLTGSAFFFLIFIFYCLIASNNRYQTDDLTFTAKINNIGLFSAIQDFFINWEANLSSIILFAILNFFQDKDLLFLNGGIFISNVLCFWFLISRLAFRVKFRFKNAQSLIIAACIIALFYSSVRAGGGVVYWATAQVAYFIPLNFLFIGLGFWYANEHKQSIAAACFFLFLFAHSRINYDASFAAVYVFFVLVNYIQVKKVNFYMQLPFLFFLMGVITYLFIPGVYKRITFHAESSIAVEQPHTVFNFIRNILVGVLHFYKTAIQNAGFWFAFFVSFFCSSIMREFLMGVFSTSFFKKIVLLLLAFNASLLLHVLVILLALKTPIGYGRVFVFVELLWLILMVLTGFIAGSKFQYITVAKLFLIATVLVYTVPLFQSNVRNLSDAKTFAKQHDERIVYLNNLKAQKNHTNVYLPALKGVEVLGYEDLQHEDTIEHVIPYPNHSIRQYYELPFMVFIKQ